MEEYITSIDEFDCGESSSTTEVQNSEAGYSASQATLENSNPATKSKVVQKPAGITGSQQADERYIQYIKYCVAEQEK
ncbi:unnamed protein product [Parnassius apollo]|uniref:(apollo) hypothetical protein n=1 Tax=Parnassius apollo TaxID=110799 RepID=A0A8S3WFS9_PARAO|nr:unnamed protein product [Parnassius apollo]